MSFSVFSSFLSKKESSGSGVRNVFRPCRLSSRRSSTAAARCARSERSRKRQAEWPGRGLGHRRALRDLASALEDPGDVSGGVIGSKRCLVHFSRSFLLKFSL